MHRAFHHLVHLILSGRQPFALVQDEEDWRALAHIAGRMLFWCGGSIHGCRCEGRELRFAVRVGGAPIGAMARHISGAYGIYLRRRRGWTGGIFKHYVAISVDAELYLDDLVIWLHRRQESYGSQHEQADICWTADSAYTTPNSLPWVTTECVLAALSPGGAGRSVYCRRKIQPMVPGVVDILSGRAKPRSRPSPSGRPRSGAEVSDEVNIESIAKFVAAYSHVSYEDMQSASRKRAYSEAKTLTTVLSTRNGASVAAVARLFGRSRSTLSERAKQYLESQPQSFVNAERALGAYFEMQLARRSDEPIADP